MSMVPRCVCGHDKAEHVESLMSVPLVNPAPIYPLPGSVFNNHINRPHPTATYEQQQCPCGCTLFTPDEM